MSEPSATLTFALAKGRLADQTLELLSAIGIDGSVVSENSRKLVFENASGDRFMLVKPADVPTYVDHGICDIGIVGKDTLLEENRPLYEMLDLGFGRCRLCVAGYAESRQTALTVTRLRVATKYPGIARQLYSARGEDVDIIKLNGSVELAPIIGLSDVILDIVESGGTLKANGLSVLEEVCPVSARLVVGPVSLKTKGARIREIIAALKSRIA